MAKRSSQSDSRRPTLEGEFVVVSFMDGKIDGAAFYRSPLVDAYRGGQSRSLVAGSKRFQVYRIKSGEHGALAFSRMEK